MKSAEELAEDFDEMQRDLNYTYCSSKYSDIEGGFNQSKQKEAEKPLEIDYSRFRPFWLQSHRHFHNIPVNTSHSSVHVPTNLLDTGK